MMVTRLAPSHGGGNWTCGALIVAVGDEVAEVLGIPEVVAAGIRFVFGQKEGGIPGRDVNRQQATKPDTESETATAAASPAIIKMTEIIFWRRNACFF